MTMRLVYAVELTLRSPFLFQGLANAMLGVDAAQLRDEKDNIVIPSDQIRGVIKEALKDLAGAGLGLITEPEIKRLFGAPSAEAKIDLGEEQNRPDRGALLFSDLTASTMRRACNEPEEPLPCAPRETTRIEIDDSTGAVKAGHVQVIELVAPFAAEVTFRGEIVALWPDNPDNRLGKALGAALAMTPAIGAFKSVGFGEIEHERSSIQLKCKHILASLKTLPPIAGTDERRAYWVTFDRPILVDAERVADNAYLGSAIVPGALFKGALAERLKSAGEEPENGRFTEALAALHFSHAFPEAEDGSPAGQPLPLSLVVTKTEDGPKFGDALLVPYDQGAVIDGQAALFTPDWKSDLFDAANKKLGHPKYDEPKPLPRTHTAIEPVQGIATEEQLFTTVSRSVLRPDNWANARKPRRWLLIADGGRVKDRTALAILFDLLEEGLEAIGKTGASAAFIRAEPEMAAVPTPAPLGGRQANSPSFCKRLP